MSRVVDHGSHINFYIETPTPPPKHIMDINGISIVTSSIALSLAILLSMVNLLMMSAVGDRNILIVISPEEEERTNVGTPESPSLPEGEEEEEDERSSDVDDPDGTVDDE